MKLYNIVVKSLINPQEPYYILCNVKKRKFYYLLFENQS